MKWVLVAGGVLVGAGVSAAIVIIVGLGSAEEPNARGGSSVRCFVQGDRSLAFDQLVSNHWISEHDGSYWRQEFDVGRIGQRLGGGNWRYYEARYTFTLQAATVQWVATGAVNTETCEARLDHHHE